MGRAPATLVYAIGPPSDLLRVAPVIAALRRRLPAARHATVSILRRQDTGLSETLAELLAIRPPDHVLDVGHDAEGAEMAHALERVERVLVAERPDVVVVSGDCNASLATALAAVKLEIPVAHLRAGLREHDRSVPEEINRVLVDRLPTWHFVPGGEAAANLAREGIGPTGVYDVGDPLGDTLSLLEGRLHRAPALEALPVAPGGYVYAALDAGVLRARGVLPSVLRELDGLSAHLPVVLPMAAEVRTWGRLAGDSAVHRIQPPRELDRLALEWGAAAVLTDASNVQEETRFFGVPCFTLRDSSPHPVAGEAGHNRLLGARPEAIRTIPSGLRTHAGRVARPAGWDGHAAERIADVLAGSLASERLAGIMARAMVLPSIAEDRRL